MLVHGGPQTAAAPRARDLRCRSADFHQEGSVMGTRLTSALALMTLLSVADTGAAQMQPTAASGAEASSSPHSQDQGVPTPAEQ